MTSSNNKSGTAPDAKANSRLESFLALVEHASRSLLMLDFDGTLAPFRKDRKTAVPYPGVVSALQNILGTGKTRIVIISGRDVSETVPLLSIKPHPEVWGLHGLQRLKADGAVELCELTDSTQEALARAENWVRSQNLEHVVEFKSGSLAVHWRGLAASEAQSMHERVMEGWTGIAKEFGLELMNFDGGVEIRSPEANKGTAVDIILSEMDPDVPAAYLGDDATDEDAFRAINFRGLSILVRSEWRQTAAHLWLKPPDELLDLLSGWLRACQKNAATGKPASFT